MSHWCLVIWSFWVVLEARISSSTGLALILSQLDAILVLFVHKDGWGTNEGVRLRAVRFFVDFGDVRALHAVDNIDLDPQCFSSDVHSINRSFSDVQANSLIFLCFLLFIFSTFSAII